MILFKVLKTFLPVIWPRSLSRIATTTLPERKHAVDDYFAKTGLKKDRRLAPFSKTIIPHSYRCFHLRGADVHPDQRLAGLTAEHGHGFCTCLHRFCVMHDANHGSYSTKPWLNDLLGLTLNAMGGNYISGNRNITLFTTPIPMWMGR